MHLTKHWDKTLHSTQKIFFCLLWQTKWNKPETYFWITVEDTRTLNELVKIYPISRWSITEVQYLQEYRSIGHERWGKLTTSLSGANVAKHAGPIAFGMWSLIHLLHSWCNWFWKPCVMYFKHGYIKMQWLSSAFFVIHKEGIIMKWCHQTSNCSLNFTSVFDSLGIC